MSLIGPRPERAEFIQVISVHIPHFPKRLEIKPGITVPMHYKIPGLSLPISDLDPFLAKNRFKVLYVGNEIDIEKEELPKEREIWIFTL